MNQKLSWRLSAFADEAGDSCGEQIAALQKAGLNFIDLRSVDGFNIVELPLENARIIKEKLDAANIEVAMFGTPIGKIDIAEDFETDLQKLRHLAELAPIFDCRAARIFSYYNKAEKPHEEWQAESIRRLLALRDEAKNLGLILYHENERHIFGDLGRDVQTLAREVRDDSFRLIFDFDNYNQSGEDVWATWETLRGATDAFHLKDSTQENEHVPAGQGNGRIAEILQDAARRGWSGPLSLEPHLSHSGAVAATGPGGRANETYKTMSPADCFHIAAEVAKELLAEVGATIS